LEIWIWIQGWLSNSLEARWLWFFTASTNTMALAARVRAYSLFPIPHSAAGPLCWSDRWMPCVLPSFLHFVHTSDDRIRCPNILSSYQQMMLSISMLCSWDCLFSILLDPIGRLLCHCCPQTTFTNTYIPIYNILWNNITLHSVNFIYQKFICKLCINFQFQLHSSFCCSKAFKVNCAFMKIINYQIIISQLRIAYPRFSDPASPKLTRRSGARGTTTLSRRAQSSGTSSTTLPGTSWRTRKTQTARMPGHRWPSSWRTCHAGDGEKQFCGIA